MHPAEKFQAPSTILPGKSLAQLLDATAIKLLAESFAAVAPFNVRRFTRTAQAGLEGLGIMERGQHLAQALAGELPTSFSEALPIVEAALGPELTKTEGNGLAIFFYLPHSQWLGAHGVGHTELALRGCYELTKRFSAEFCIRPLLVNDLANMLSTLNRWTSDPNPHVRRLVSEGTRTRLPWGLRLKSLQADPRPTLQLLEKLKDDPIPYVHRSVANHLGDTLKDQPELAYGVLERWLKEVQRRGTPEAVVTIRHWVIRHAVRLPAKQGDERAILLRAAAKG